MRSMSKTHLSIPVWSLRNIWGRNVLSIIIICKDEADIYYKDRMTRIIRLSWWAEEPLSRTSWGGGLLLNKLQPLSTEHDPLLDPNFSSSLIYFIYLLTSQFGRDCIQHCLSDSLPKTCSLKGVFLGKAFRVTP